MNKLQVVLVFEDLSLRNSILTFQEEVNSYFLDHVPIHFPGDAMSPILCSVREEAFAKANLRCLFPEERGKDAEQVAA